MILQAALCSESYVINTTIAKSEFGTKNQLFFLGGRKLATGKMF